MRILKIELQNINSLRCESPIIIDFESEHFRDVGLFAITGSTGAGKTTLLDAITIGLYHSVPRFNLKNSRGNLQDVVSYGADHAMARITFQASNVRYEAFWSMRLRQKGGKVLTNPREEVRLKDLSNEKILAEKKTQVKSMVEEITQLNYQQFLRSVMLAQGEFAAFLSADNKDKGTLLEQITGEEIYKKIGEVLGTRIGEERWKLEQIDKRINLVDLLSAEQKQELKLEKESFDGQLKLIDEEIKHNESRLAWYVRQDELDKQKLELDQRHENLILQQKQFYPHLLLLNKHQEAEPFQSNLTDIVRLEKDLNKKQADHKLLTDSIKELEAKVKLAEEQDVHLKKELSEKEHLQAQWQPKLEQVAQFDAQIETQKENTSRLEQEIKTLTQNMDELVKSKAILSKELDEKTKEKIQVETHLEEHKSLLDIEQAMQNLASQFTTRKGQYEQGNKLSTELKALDEKLELCVKQINDKSVLLEKELPKTRLLEKEILNLNQKLKANDLQALMKEYNEKSNSRDELRELLSKAKLYEEEMVKRGLLTQQQTQLKTEYELLSQKNKQCNEEVLNAKTALDDARKILELENRIKSFEVERQKLIEGEPCGLCGSTTHPYVKQYAHLEVDRSKQAVQKRELKYAELLKEEKKQSIKLAESQKQLEILAQNINETKAKLEDLKTQFSSTSLQLSIENKDEILNHGLTIKSRLEELEKQIQQIQQWQKDKDAKDQMLQDEKDKCNALTNALDVLKQENKNLLQLKSEKENEIQLVKSELKQLELELTSNLNAYRLDLPEPKATDAFLNEINTSIKSYHQKSNELNGLLKLLSETTIKLQHTEEAIKTNNEDKAAKEIVRNEQETREKQLVQKRCDLLPLEISTQAKRTELQDLVNSSRRQHEAMTQELNKIKSQLSSDLNSRFKLQSDIDDQKVSLSQLSNELDNALAESDFKDRAELESALISLDEKKALQAEQQKLEAAGIELKTLKSQLETALEKQNRDKVLDAGWEEVKQVKVQLSNKKDAFLKRSGELEQILAKDKEITERNKGVVQEKRAQEKILKTYRDLQNLLGGSKHAFNTYVQRLTLKNLIALANRHLFKLNRRYSLKMNEQYKNGEELNFMLVDHYQTDECRLVDTSSGGEKFLISLSLALGLSDLASKNVSIGSLFIDEGFGTLDNSTLETVIATLSTLQSQGKMIGVISHVENLKDRISTQIKVMKTKNGISEVEIV